MGEVVEETFDVVVIGGGLAGICAAIAAARHGARTVLLQDRPVLGGNSSNEIRVSITGASAMGRNPFARESGIIEELLTEDRFRSSTPFPVNGEPRPDWDWLLLEWASREPNLVVLLNTTAIEPLMDPESGAIRSVRARQAGTADEMLLHGTYFIDASGDGDIAAKAGATFRYGREGKLDTKESLAPLRGDKQVLGSSLMFSARNVGHPVKFAPPAWAYAYPDEKDLSYREHERVSEGYWWIEWGGNKDTVADNDEIRDELLKMVYGVWDHIKNHGSHKAEYLVLDWIGSVVGKRESRRFLGDYVLKQEDLEQRPQFPDAVAYGGWPIDIHPAEGMKAREMPTIQIYPAGPYSIPLRSLYSKDVPNLFFAGRNISATHLAFASTRVMGTCAVQGQAVGTAAALCLCHQCVPSELAARHIRELQQTLIKDDCYLVGLRSEDADDRLRRAKVTESSHQGPFEVTQFETMIALDESRAQMFTVSEPYLERFSAYLASTAKQDVQVKATLYKAQHLTDFTSTDAIAAAVVTMPVGKRAWVGFPFQVPVEPGACYWVALDQAKGVSWGSVEQAIPGALRAERMAFRKMWLSRAGCHTFRLTPQSWPYRGQNVVNGVTRPAFGPSLWVSSQQERLPQYIEFELPQETELDTVYITFDTNLDKVVPFGPAPECVRDYRLSYYDGQRWRDLFDERGNHQRRRRHEFATVRTTALRLT
ncbi:MAG: FAD-dependent oxidoreductase, partial [Anaerolineae bacterium]